MAHSHFTRQLAGFLDVPTVDVAAPRLRGYVLDDALRPDSQVDICRHFLEVYAVRFATP